MQLTGLRASPPIQAVMADSPSSSSGHVGVRARTSQVPPLDFGPEPKGIGARILIAIFVGVPFLALLTAVPLAWGSGLGWHIARSKPSCLCTSRWRSPAASRWKDPY
jgi:stearoyl-CoA desaturase (delta-9 desaturase)